MHVHISALSLIVTALYMVIIGFVFRLIETTWPDSTAAKALAYIH